MIVHEHTLMFIAVVDEHFVDKIGDKTAILRNTCRQRFCFVDIIMYYFEKERIHLKN